MNSFKGVAVYPASGFACLLQITQNVDSIYCEAGFFGPLYNNHVFLDVLRWTF